MSLYIRTCFTTILSLCILFCCQFSSAQTAVDKEQRQVTAIYQLTKKAKSISDYSGMIDQCDTFLLGEFSGKNRLYVSSLKGWALARRANLRFETAQQLQDVGNSQSEQANQKAMTDFDTSLQAAPQRWRTWLARGVARTQLSQLELAIDDFSQAIERNQELNLLWFNRAEARYELGQYQTALKDYQQARKLKENDWQAVTGHGHCLFALERFDEALADYQAVVKVFPKNVHAQINLGDVCQRLARWQDAEQAYKKSISLDPTAVALQRFAWLKATCPNPIYRDPNGAHEFIEQAINLDGETPCYLDTLAAVLAAQGEFHEAQQTEGKAIQLATATQEDSLTIENTSATKEYKIRMALYEEGVAYQQDEN